MTPPKTENPQEHTITFKATHKEYTELVRHQRELFKLPKDDNILHEYYLRIMMSKATGVYFRPRYPTCKYKAGGGAKPKFIRIVYKNPETEEQP